jgi:hypothetical protein
MTKKQILEEVLVRISERKFCYICPAIQAVSECSNAEYLLLHFSNPNRIPKRYRGAYWRGEPMSGLWTWRGRRMRISYLKHLISKL